MNIKRLMHMFADSDKIFDPKENVEYHVVTHVSDFWIENDEICLETTLTNLQKATIRISLLNDEIIRFKYSQKYFPKNKFNQHIILKNHSLPKYKISNEKVEIFVDSGTEEELKETKILKFPFQKNTKEFIVTFKPFNIEIKDIKKDKIQFALNWRDGFTYFGGFTAPGLGFKQVADDVWLPFLSWSIANDESFYGLGETFSKLEKTGVRKTIWNSDTSGKSNSDLSYNALPFIQSTNNWGLLLDSGNKSYFDIAASVSDAGSLLNTDQFLDIYFFVGNSIKDVISSYTLLTGRHKGIDDQAYGIWISRLYYYDRKDVFDEIKKAKENKFIVDVMNIDPKWLKNRYTKSCNFVEATERFGDFKKFYEDTKSEGINISLWINPYIQGDNSEFFTTAKEKGYLLKDNSGSYAHPYTGVEVYQPDNYIIDFTNPEAFQYWKNSLKKQVEKGAKYFIVDYGDGVPAEASFSNGHSGLQMKQYFQWLYNKAAFDAVKEVNGENRTANISRSGFIGTQSFPGKWGGDSYSRWSELKNSLQAGLSLSMAGEVFWGTDIGGFVPKPTEELYLRWVQFGAFNPYTRLHGITKREPWYFSQEAVKQSNFFFQIKRSWLPQYKMLEYESSKNGIPGMRPLVLQYQNDKIARLIDDQYLIGENIMVAPIINRGATSREIYFPEGNWINYFNPKNKYVGKSLQSVKAELNEIPVFIKENSVLLTFKNGKYKFNKIQDEVLVLNICQGKEDFNYKRNLKINNKLIKIDLEIKTNEKPKIKIDGWDKFEIKIISNGK